MTGRRATKREAARGDETVGGRDEFEGGRATPRRVLLTGFMGAGKTTTARELARQAGGVCLDLDEFVAAREGRSPRQLIEEEGEAAFREAETRALADALERGAARFIALGGGAWAREGNRVLAAGHDCLTVWLDAPFELCWRRILEGGGDRPLAREKESARRLYEERRATYRLAPLRVRVTREKSVGRVAGEILAALRSQAGV